MRRFSYSHDADHVLLRDTRALVGQDSETSAELIARLAEIDARKLYRAAGFSSMHAFCVGDFHLSEDAASKRIHAARAAREFPVLFAAVADGRLHLSAVVMLASHLHPWNVEELVAAAAHKSKSQIERLLAERFPRADLPARLEPIVPIHLGQAQEPAGDASRGLAGDSSAPTSLDRSQAEHAPGHVPVTDSSQVVPPDEHALGHVPALSSSPPQPSSAAADRPLLAAPAVPPTPRPRITPRSPGRFALQGVTRVLIRTCALGSAPSRTAAQNCCFSVESASARVADSPPEMTSWSASNQPVPTKLWCLTAA